MDDFDPLSRKGQRCIVPLAAEAMSAILDIGSYETILRLQTKADKGDSEAAKGPPAVDAAPVTSFLAPTPAREALISPLEHLQTLAEEVIHI